MLFLNARPSDAQVVRRVLRGRKEDFRLLVERYLGVVEAVAYTHVRNQADAEDAVQNAFLKAYTSLDSLREPAKFGAWIRTIARNAAVTVQRSKQRDAALRDVLPEQPNAEEQDLDRRELRLLLRREIDQLDENQREILLLFYFADKSLREIAALIELTPNAAKKRLHRARAALSTRLTDEIGDLLKTDHSRTTVTGIMAAIAATQASWESAAATTITGAIHTLAVGKVIVGAGIAVVSMVIITVSFFVLARHVPLPGRDNGDTPEIEAATVTDARPAIGDETAQADGDTDTNDSILLAQESVDNASATSEAKENLGDYRDVSGVVIGPDTQPVPGALVWAVSYERSAIATRETVTNQDGEFSIWLDDGSWSLRARQGTLAGEAIGSIQIDEEEPLSPLTVTLEPRGTLRGTLLDTDTGQPISNGRIWLDEGVIVTADSAGRFTYAGLRMADHKVYAITPGYERKRFLFDTSLRDDAGIVLRFSRAGAVQGKVVNEYGNLIPGAIVGNPGSGSTIALKARFTTTDQGGFFLRDGVAFDKPHRFRAQAEGYEESDYQWITLSPDEPTADLLFVLSKEEDESASDPRPGEEPLRFIRGTVRSASGDPVPEAEVAWLGWDSESETVTNEYGEFVLDDAPDQPGTLQTLSDGFVPKYTSVSAGYIADLNIGLSIGQSATGLVNDINGDPIEGVLVIPTIRVGFDTKSFRGHSDTTTDTEGRFALKAFNTSSMMVDLLRSDYSYLRGLTLMPAPEENKFTLDAGGAVRGKVVLPNGAPTPEFALFIQGTKESSNRGSMFAGYKNIGIQFANADGEFVVRDLTAGKDYRVVASAPGYGDAFADPVVAEPINALSPAQDLQLTLPEARDAYIQVVRAGDERAPIPNAHAQLLQRNENSHLLFSWPASLNSWNRSIRKRADADGLIRLESVPFKEATLILRAQGYARELLVWNSERTDITMAMKPEAVISGMAFDNPGSPLLEGTVYLRMNNRGREDIWTMSFSVDLSVDNPGAFLFDELPAGEYTLMISQGNNPIARSKLTLNEGESVEITTDEMEPVKPTIYPALELIRSN